MLQPSVQGWDAGVRREPRVGFGWDAGVRGDTSRCTGRQWTPLKYEAEPDVAARSASCPNDRLFPVTCLPVVALLTLRLVMKDALTSPLMLPH